MLKYNRKIAMLAIPLDLTGRPKFPISLGDLTIHSIGEVSDIMVT